jgi:hypothetical protein
VARPEQLHRDTRDESLAHFNSIFRHRYNLPRLTKAALEAVTNLDEVWGGIGAIRQGGVRDASCAVLARIALSVAPRYAIGLVDWDGKVHVLSPQQGDPASYRGRHALLVNPLGGRDNWRDAARWVREIGGNRARQTTLAGLASEDRPDHAANDALLRAASPMAIVLPADEAFSADRAAEVSFVYDVPVETLRAWKRRHRANLAASRPGRPKNR